MKKYLYEIMSSAGTLSTEDILLRSGASILFGMMVFISYRLTHKGSIYSKKFNITLMTLTLLTTTVMTVIGNNVALSLGMVGALSIVRFRTSIKDSRDTIYIFWTIIIGICCGVGDFTVAAIGSAAVFLVLLVFGQVRDENRMLLIIRGNRSSGSQIRKLLFEYFKVPPAAKVENTTADKVELIFELSRKMLKAAEKREQFHAAEQKRQVMHLTELIYGISGIDSASLVTQSDEIT